PRATREAKGAGKAVFKEKTPPLLRLFARQSPRGPAAACFAHGKPVRKTKRLLHLGENGVFFDQFAKKRACTTKPFGIQALFIVRFDAFR
ncbi:MAG: hypothetical protein IJU56_04825, partial [Clostridia bacterium]|nr:hypothetical protein [Clostridia bacterium]